MSHEVPPLSVVLCPYVLAGLRGHSALGCPFEHDRDAQRDRFLTWAKWEEPEDVAVECELDRAVVDWGHVPLRDETDEPTEVVKKYVVVMCKDGKCGLVVEEVLGLAAGFEVAGHPPPVDGFVKLAPPVRVAPNGQRSLCFAFVPHEEGFFECEATLSCNRRAVVLRVTLQALVLSGKDCAELSLVCARLAIASPFFPLSFRQSVWSAPAEVYEAQSLAPLQSEGLRWTPVELAYYVNSQLPGGATMGAITHPMAQGALEQAATFDFIFRLQIAPEKGPGGKAKRRMAQRARSRIQATLDEEAIAKKPANETYTHRLCRLLVLEELAVDQQVLVFDQYHRELAAVGQLSPSTGEQLYVLVVPGASEQRPQLQRGDFVRVRPVSQPGLEAACTVQSVNVRTSAVTVAAPFLPCATRPTPLAGPCHVRFAWPHARFRRMYGAVLRCGERFANPQILDKHLAPAVNPWDLSHPSFAAGRLSSEQKKGNNVPSQRFLLF